MIRIRLQKTLWALAVAVMGLSMWASPLACEQASAWHRHHGWGHGWYRPYYAWSYPSYSYTSFRVGYSFPIYRPYHYSYSYYYPSVTYYYSAPVVAAPVYYAPTYYAPVYYDPCVSNTSTTTVAPADYVPGYSTEPSYSTGISGADSTLLARSSSTNQSSISTGSFVDRMMSYSTSKVIVPSTENQTRSSMLASASTATTSARSGKTVSLGSAASATDSQLSELPAALLQSADKIFAAGGYQEAASAYARLTLRFGNHDELIARRFLALVASGDCAQAAVVYELAQAQKVALTTELLPGKNLRGLYGSLASNRVQHCDTLAAYALSNPNDLSALAMVGTWLTLDGQEARAELFLNTASPKTEHPSSNKSPRLVVTAVSK